MSSGSNVHTLSGIHVVTDRGQNSGPHPAPLLVIVVLLTALVWEALSNHGKDDVIQLLNKTIEDLKITTTEEKQGLSLQIQSLTLMANQTINGIESISQTMTENEAMKVKHHALEFAFKQCYEQLQDGNEELRQQNKTIVDLRLEKSQIANEKEIQIQNLTLQINQATADIEETSSKNTQCQQNSERIQQEKAKCMELTETLENENQQLKLYKLVNEQIKSSKMELDRELSRIVGYQDSQAKKHEEKSEKWLTFTIVSNLLWILVVILIVRSDLIERNRGTVEKHTERHTTSTNNNSMTAGDTTQNQGPRNP